MKRKQRKFGDRVQLVVDEMLHLLGHSSRSSADTARVRSLQLTKLEERVLMSASPMAMVAEIATVIPETSADASIFGLSATSVTQDVNSVDSQVITVASLSGDSANDSTASDVAAEATYAVSGIELIVIDSRVQDADTLLSELLASDRDFRILRLDAEISGIAQVTEKLEQVGNVTAIHLLTHGRDGEILLGATRLNAATLAQHVPELLAWQTNLTANADLLLYGCDVGESVEGRDFVDSLSRLTGADIAASTNATGSPRFGGDWELEYQLGAIETQTFGDSGINGEWNDLLGVITVTTTTDELDGNVSSVAALLANKGFDGLISLREAIIATNNTVGADTIYLTAGTFRFSIAGNGENSAFSGDLDIKDSVTIIGAGSGLSVIDANSMDRVFELRGAISATIEDVTIRGGSLSNSNWGGGILIDSDSTLHLSRVVVTGNTTGSGAGIYNYGTLVATDTSISNNTASDWGGGLYNDRGNVTLNRVTISGNTAGKDGGGIENTGSGAAMSLTNVTLSGNTATDDGGGIWTSQSVTATNVTIAFNNAASGDGIFVSGGETNASFRNSMLYNPLGSNANRALTSLGNNIDSDGSAGLTLPSDQSGINPKLDATLRDNGGFVRTHRLLFGSAAIDMGSTVSVPTVDARNTARDGAPDIGAYEVQGLLAARGELLANTATTNTQSTSSESRGSTHAVAADRDGNYVVVWSSLNQDGGGWGVYGQRFNAAGNKVGLEFRINQTTTSDQKYATVAMNGRGDFVVAWTSVNQDTSGNGVYARRYGADGTVLGNEFRVNTTTTGAQDSPVVAMAADGRFLIVWEGQGTGDTDGIFGQWYAANGTPSGSEVLINTTTSGVQGEPSVAMALDGRAVVVWSDSNGVWAQRYNAAGTTEGAEIHVESDITAGSADVEMAADGSFVVAYRQTNLDEGIYFRRFDNTGSPRSVNAQIANTTTFFDQTDPSIAMDDSGNFLIVWQGNGTGDADGVFGRSYTSSGTATSFEFRINETTSGLQSMASAAMLTGGNFVVAWSGSAAADSSGVYTRQFVNAPPTITAIADQVIAENGTTGPLSFTIGDAETSVFGLNVTATSSNPALVSPSGLVLGGFGSNRTLTVTPNAGYSGTATITVIVNDGFTTTSETFELTVIEVNVAPVITSNGGGVTATVSVAENSTAVTTVTATDADLPTQTLMYTISGGADASKFSINIATGALSFITAPDFEVPTDSGLNNVYDVEVQVTDGTLTDTQAITVTVTAANDNTPTITSNGGGATASISVAENSTGVTTVTATDADLPAQTLTYSIFGGADASKFLINSATGALTFATAPNFESPSDSGPNNVYDVVVRVSDGTFTDTQSIAVTVTAVNDIAPTITSNGGGTTATISVVENSTVVTTVSATDADLPGPTLTYSISGGADASKFLISSSTGALSFIVAPDFEAANDAGANNVYDVTVRVSDGSLIDTQEISVTVTNSTTADVLIATQDTYINSVSPTLNYGQSTSLIVDRSTGGIGASRALVLFDLADIPANVTITSATLVMQSTQNSGPFDVNIYQVTQAWQEGSGNGSAGTANWTQRQTGVNWNATGGAYASTIIATLNTAATGQHTWNVTSLVADWYDGNKLNYGMIIGSPNLGTGTVTYDSAEGAIAPQLLVTFDASNAPPTITSNGGGASATVSVTENSTAVTTVTATDVNVPGQTLTYAISGGADAAKFMINSSTGVLTFLTAPNYELPTDAGTNNIYNVTVQVSDGLVTDTQAISVTVTPSNDNTPVIASNGGGANAAISVAENTTAVTTVTATDADLPGQTLTYSISGGADAASFTINYTTGVLEFASPRNFESPVDADGNNVYDVIVVVSDGLLTDTQAIAVTVTAINDNSPVISSNGGGANAVISTSENTTAVTTVIATDADLPAQSLTYAISGGADASKFAINSTTGLLAFISAPNFETAADAGANNTYDVIVHVSDGTFSDTQAIAVMIAAVNDNAPSITSNSGGDTAAINIAENTTAVSTVTATDADLPAQNLTYSILGGADAAMFSIDSTTGALTFAGARNFESPADIGANNVYDVIVRVSDGTLTDTQAIAVTVNSVNDNTPVITSNGGGETAAINVAEDSTSVTTVTATDADLPSPILNYSIIGGADAARFTINGTTGVLKFATAPNYELPADSGANNVYNVTVQVSDGTRTDSQAIDVTVTPVNEAPDANAGDNVTIDEGGSVTLDASDSDDPDGDSITYRWDIDNDGIYGELAEPTLVNPTLTWAMLNSFGILNDGTYTIRLEVNDGNGGTDTDTLTLRINNVSPTITSANTITVDENVATVMTITSADPVDAVIYSITGGSDQGRFTINSVTGALSFVATPDFEAPADSNANNVYVVHVTANDGDGGSVNQTILVTVVNVNEAPSLNVVQPVLSLVENASTLTATDIASLTITDDGTGTNSLSLAGADAGHFEIVGTSLRLKAGTPLNFEAKTSYTVQVVLNDATLAGGPFATQNITLNVTNVDEAPTADAGGPYAIAEGGSLTVTAGPATDPEGLPLTYQWDIDNDGSFDDATGSAAVLTWTQLKSLSIPVNDSGARVVRVRVTDAGGNSGVDSTVLTVSDTVPTINVTGAATAVSGTPYTINIAASDPGNDTISSFRIVWGDGTSQVVSGTTTTVLHTYSTPGATRSISVTATNEDGTHAMTGGPLFVTVANTAPSAVTLDNVRVPGLTARAVVGNVTFNDPDFGDSHTITVSDTRFQMVSGQLKLKAGTSLNPNVEVNVPVTITVTDLSGASASAAFVVEVNRTPVATTIPVTAAEDFGTLTVSTASAFTDPDGDALAYTMAIVSQDAGLLTTLTIDSVTGQVTATSASNRFGSAVIDVTATDLFGASAIARLNLFVQPVNDAPVAQDYSNSTFIDSTLTVAIPGIRASISDVDGDPVTVTLVSGPASGTVVLMPDGGFVYTPAIGFQGIDTFRFVASDGVDSSNVATATISVVPQFIGPGSGGSSSNNSTGTGSQSSTTTTTSGSSASTTTGSSSGTTSSTETGGNSTSASTTSGTGTGNNSESVPGASSPSEGTSVPDDADSNEDDEIFGVLQINAPETALRIESVGAVTSLADSGRTTDNDFVRRTLTVTQRFDFDRVFSSLNSNEEFVRLNAQRESLYRQLSESVVEQSESVAEQLENSTHFKGRVVGSVGVVTTGFSVGYLFWAIRGGMLVSGLLAQVPACTMLDPLLVIDGDQKEDDKESLQNLMDRQQAKMNRTEETAKNPEVSVGQLET